MARPYSLDLRERVVAESCARRNLFGGGTLSLTLSVASVMKITASPAVISLVYIFYFSLN